MVLPERTFLRAATLLILGLGVALPAAARITCCDVDGKRVLIAQGGQGGLGNIHFKSSVNRAPRQCTPGGLGAQRELKLELKVLADVGLLGLPNAGK